MKNLEQALQAAAARLDAAIKREIEARKHNRTGRLSNSVKTEVEKGPTGYGLKTQMEDYGAKLNQRSGFLDAAISSEEEAIHRMIEEATESDIDDLLDNDI